MNNNKEFIDSLYKSMEAEVKADCLKGKAGRKTVKDKLKVINFRLSIEDIKKIDKLGVGKNSSEKLRYILSKYQGDKINSQTRRPAYKVERSKDVELLNNKYNLFFKKWKNLDKNNFLMTTSLANIIINKKRIKVEKYIENNEYFDKLETYGWKIESVDFKFEDQEEYYIILSQNNNKVSFYIGETEEDLNENDSVLSDRENELLSFLFRDLQADLHSLKTEKETENIISKTYSNGDVYKMIEYGNISIVEYEYLNNLNISVLTAVKGLKLEETK